MGHMINRQSHAFSCNSGNNCTRNRLNCTQLRLVQLAVARAIIPELHSKACDYLYELFISIIFFCFWAENLMLAQIIFQ